MTTTRQVERALRPLLERHDDLALMPRLLIIKPVHHILRAILIDRTRDKNSFRPVWYVLPLFDLVTFHFLTWGNASGIEPSMHPGVGRNWDWSKPDTVELLTARIERALTRLRSIDSLQSIIDLNLELCRRYEVGPECIFWNHPEAHLAILAAMGEFEAVTPKLRTKIDLLNPSNARKPTLEDFERFAFAKQLLALVSDNDRGAVAALLHAQERATVERLKLTHLWEPTPFPMEGGAS